MSRACEGFRVMDLADLSVVTWLVKPEAGDRGLRLGLTSAWGAARKQKEVKWYLGSQYHQSRLLAQLKVSLFVACKWTFLPFSLSSENLLIMCPSACHCCISLRMMFTIKCTFVVIIWNVIKLRFKILYIRTIRLLLWHQAHNDHTYI